MPTPLLVVADGRITIANPAATALGLGEGLLLETVAGELAGLSERALSEGRVMRLSECVLRDGETTRVHRVEIAPFTDDAGVASGAIFLTDVTALTETSDELARIVIDSEIAERRLKNHLGYLSSLARFGGLLLETSDPEAIPAAIAAALEETGLFGRALVVTDENDPVLASLGDAERTRLLRILRDPTIEAEDGNPLVIHGLRGRDRSYGAIAVWRRRDLLDEERFDLQPFASLAGFTLDNISLYRDLVGSLRDLSFRNRVGRALQESLSQRDIEENLTELLRSHMPISWFRLVTVPDDPDHPPEIAPLLKQAFRGHRAIQDFPSGAAICVPLRVGGAAGADRRPDAVLAAFSPTPGLFRGAHREIFIALADLTAITLRNVLMYNDLKAHNVAVQYLNEELSSAVDDLKAANEMKSRFVSIVSHEFRTPLTSILSYADTLHDGFESIDASTTRSFLSVIKEETARLTRLINQLLDLSRIQARDRPLARESVRLTDLVARLERAIRPVVAAKALVFDQEIAPDAGAVIGDPDALLQVLVNLLGNAARYTPAGGRIELQVTGDVDFAYIRVKDTGIGIPSDSLDAIFSEFYTVPQARIETAGESSRVETVTGGTGTGLGLSIACAIVERHGGSIAVTSEIGAGSTFTVTLPRTKKE
jgi:signal transduction histidine kinase